MLDALCFSYTVPCTEENAGVGQCNVCSIERVQLERRTFKADQLDASSTDAREVDACWSCRKLAQQQVITGRYKPRPILKSKPPRAHA